MTSDDRSTDRRRRAHPDDDPVSTDGFATDAPVTDEHVMNDVNDVNDVDDVDGTGERRRRRDDDATGPIPRRDNWGRRIDPETGRAFDRRQTDRMLPRWAVPAIVLFWLGFLLSMVARHVFHRLSGLLLLLLISVFLTFAIEPGVDRLARRGWRRGTATATILLGVLVTFLVFVVAIGSLVGR
ncbi:MAG: hypothetical protein ABJ382_06450, partial [Ilumatobacter sp.]